MNALRLTIVAVLALVQSQDARLSWVANPRTASGSWVADPARHLRPATVASMDSTISALERETTAEIAVVVLDSLDGLEPVDAAQLLHRRWGVGKANRDNGILFLWSPALRRTQVSVGYGLEGVLIDSRVGRIQDQSVIPDFRRGDFDAGMLAGVRALAAAAAEEKYTGLDRVQAGRPGPDQGGRGDGKQPGAFIGAVAGVGALLSILAAFAVARWRRYRPRRCPRGHGPMKRLDEKRDDAYLSAVESLEERLASVDYDVWACTSCDQRLVIPYKRWTSSYKECPTCKRRTCKTSSRTIKSATTTSSGLREVRRLCKNCGFADSKHEVIPVVTSSSSGGSSFSGGGGGGGGSSFGGGSAGGGGAGRSY
jgi:uncharacterized protein